MSKIAPPYEFQVLATYNSEIARGIVHTDEWKRRMAHEQWRFDNQDRRCGALPAGYEPGSLFQAFQPCYLPAGHKWPPHSFDPEFIRAQAEAQAGPG